MTDEVKCLSCESTHVEWTTSALIQTGDGTPVEAQSYNCKQCGWTFIKNTVAGPIPRIEPADLASPQPAGSSDQLGDDYAR